MLSLQTHLPYLLHPLRTIIESYQISTTYVEAVEILYCFLGIEDILVDDESCSFFIASFSLADLSDGSESSENIVHFFSGYFVGEIADEDDFVDFWSETNGFFLCAVYSRHSDSLIK